jgi:predicted NUDIX family NTP pyrophosphohydrolase
MTKKSAGILLYRKVQGGLEVLLVHPGGPFWHAKDDGVWSIPKGEFSDEEIPLEAAKREFQEETGFDVNGEFHALNPLKQSSGKTVYAWAVEGNIDNLAVESNKFSMEWPPGSGNFREFPEVDQAEWFPLDVARQKLLKGQTAFLDQLKIVI